MWFRVSSRTISSFSSKLLSIETTTTPKLKPVLDDKLAFGMATSDYMLDIDWSDANGWGAPRIIPYQPLQIDPATSVLHYGTECFEGLKAYKNSKGQILMFRPDLNMKRLRRSAEAVGLPDFEENELLRCIEKLIVADESWIPTLKGYSLYIRPTFIGTHVGLGVSKPKNAKLFVINSTVGPYFPSGLKPIHLYCDEGIVRAFPGGSGDKKIGANYAPGIGHTARLQSKGFNQILWLCNTYVTEAGTMNFFVYWYNKKGEKELITCELDGTILPGVTRDSILKITKGWGEFKVTEGKYTINDFIESLVEGRVIEAFGAGTACIVCPVDKITYKDKVYSVPVKLGIAGGLTKRLQDEILSIQYGEKEHEFQHLIR